MNEKPEDSDDLSTLEDKGTTVEGGDSAGDASTLEEGAADTDKPTKPQKPKRSIKNFAARINIYLLFFILLIIIAAIVTFVSYQKNREEIDKKEALNTAVLSQETLDQLKQSDVKVGDPKQILNVESNAIFSGKVLIRDGLEVAGQLKIGGPLNLPGITVSGSSSFDQVAINNLQISGNATVQGQLAIEQGLTVRGSVSIGGALSAAQLTIDTLQVNRDLQLNRHIDAGGGTPGISPGGALGGGGTTSVSGTDTAGTVNINAGGGAGNGCFATINFTQKFNTTPHVVITPVGASGGNVNYYINRSATNFSICANGAVSGSFAFDYIVID